MLFWFLYWIARALTASVLHKPWLQHRLAKLFGRTTPRLSSQHCTRPMRPRQSWIYGSSIQHWRSNRFSNTSRQLDATALMPSSRLRSDFRRCLQGKWQRLRHAFSRIPRRWTLRWVWQMAPQRRPRCNPCHKRVQRSLQISNWTATRKSKLFPEAGSEVSPTYIEMRLALTTRIEALLAAKMLDTATYKAYLSGMPHPTRDDGLNSRQLLQWEWAFNKALAIWLATQMAAPTKTSDDEDSLMEDSQQVSSSEGAGSSCEGSGSKAPVAPQNSSHIQSGHQAIVPEVSLHSSTVDPTIQDASASGSPNMAPAAMETQATNDDESLPSGQSTPFNQVNPDSQTDQSPLTMAEVLAQGLIKDADWMKMRTVVMRVQRQKFFITVTRD